MLFREEFGNVFIKTSNYSEPSDVMSLSPLLPPFSFFPSPTLVLQLSGGGRTRTKRQIVVDDDMNQPHIIEPQAAIRLGPRKESYLLVRS